MKAKWIVGTVVGVLLLSRPVLAAPPCVGDCEGTGLVTVDELVKGVAIALGTVQLDQCPSVDGDGKGSVTVNELVTAVNNALNGCPDLVGTYYGTVDLNDGQTAVMDLAVFGGSIAKCPVEEFGVTRVVDWGVSHSGGAIVPGLTFNLSKAFGASNLNYREGTVGPTLKTWTAASGTLTVDAVEGNRITFHVSNARMEPGAVYPFGPPAAGTFTLDFSGVVDVTINNS